MRCVDLPTPKLTRHARLQGEVTFTPTTREQYGPAPPGSYKKLELVYDGAPMVLAQPARVALLHLALLSPLCSFVFSMVFIAQLPSSPWARE